MEQKKVARKPWTLREFGGKTVWDWLQLLIVPLMLALITVVFTWQQDARQQHIEDQRAEAERELAERSAQDEALQAYLDQMSTLLLEKNLRTSEEGSEVRTLAEARTLTALQRLDADHNRIILRFLRKAKLIHGGRCAVSLTFADLKGANLRGANLSHAYLHQAHLERANLQGADLRGAVLTDAKVTDDQLADAGSLEGVTMPNG